MTATIRWNISCKISIGTRGEFSAQRRVSFASCMSLTVFCYMNVTQMVVHVSVKLTEVARRDVVVNFLM